MRVLSDSPKFFQINLTIDLSNFLDPLMEPSNFIARHCSVLFSNKIYQTMPLSEKFETSSNDYIENHITEFYLDQNADISEIAYSYLRTHPIPSISVIMLFDDFLCKKGLKHIPSNNSGIGSPLHLWAKTHKGYRPEVRNGNDIVMNRYSIYRMLPLFDLDEVDEDNKTAFEYIKRTGLIFMTEDMYESGKDKEFKVDIKSEDIVDEYNNQISDLIDVYAYSTVLHLKTIFLETALSNKDIGFSVFTDKFILCHPYLFEITEDDDIEVLRLAYLRTHKQGKIYLPCNQSTN